MGSVSSGGWLASLVLCGVYAHTDAAASLLVLAAGSGTGLVTWSQEPRHCSGIWQLAHHWSKGTVSIWWLWVLSGLSSAPHVLLPTTLSHRLNILLELPSVPAHKSNSSVKNNFCLQILNSFFALYLGFVLMAEQEFGFLPPPTQFDILYGLTDLEEKHIYSLSIKFARCCVLHSIDLSYLQPSGSM